MGGLSPSPESGGPIPLSPPLLRRLCRCEELSTHLSISVISKVLERVVLRRGYSSISRSMIFRVCSPPIASVTCTETAIARVLSDILMALDRGDVAALGLLDLSAAFDTVDQCILYCAVCVSWHPLLVKSQLAGVNPLTDF